MSARTPRPRRARGAQETLAQVVLAFESIIVFLAGLAVFAVVMMAASGVVRWRWGIVLGWVLQVLLALSAFLVPSILIAALIFGGMWAYATIKGASLDRRNARLAAASPPANGV